MNIKVRAFLTLALIVAVCVLTAPQFTSAQTSKKYANGLVSDNGDITLPADFRESYQFLGAWAAADDEGKIGQHIVYTQKPAVEAYKKNGQFPDGAVIVKELFNGHTEDMNTRRAMRAADVAGYFVMVKDAKGRFPGNNLWGDGWGWAFFKAGERTNTPTKDYKDECLAYHEPVRNTDLIYIDGYPLLK